MTRPDRNTWLMTLAHIVAIRSTCSRRKVGAVLAKDGRLVSTGYAGSPPNRPHCIDDGCILENGHCIRTIHAEINALIQANHHGVPTGGLTLYTTDSPCDDCRVFIIGSGIHTVYFHRPYRGRGGQRTKLFGRFKTVKQIDPIPLDELEDQLEEAYSLSQKLHEEYERLTRES